MKQIGNSVEDFLDQKEVINKINLSIEYAKKIGATGASINLDAGVGFNVNVRLGEVETVECNRDNSVDIVVYLGNKKGVVSLTTLGKKDLFLGVDKALELAKIAQEDQCAAIVEEELLAKNIQDLDLYHPWSIDLDEAVAIAKSCEDAAFAYDKKITNSEGAGVVTRQDFSVYATSNGFFSYSPYSSHTISCSVIAEAKQQMERDAYYSSGCSKDNLLDPIIIGEKAAKRAVGRLNSQKLSTRKAPILLVPEVAASLLGKFLRAIYGSSIYRKKSFLVDKIGKEIFPNYFNIYERPHIKKSLYSSYFDDDGIATRDKDIVTDGRLDTYLTGIYSARKLKQQPTGNAGGACNVFIDYSANDFAAMTKKMGTGLIVIETMGDGINILTGDYSRGASGFWVENGVIQYPVSEVTIAGNLSDMFKNIVAVGNDVLLESNIKTGSILLEEMMIGG